MKVLITGTARGIGRACALRYLEAGHEVIGFDIRESSISSDRYTHYIADITGELPEIEGVEVLVNNAGVQEGGNEIDVNLKGTIAVTEKYAITFPLYAASKGGILAYMKNVALRIAQYGATCNSISAGGVLTELNRHIIEDPNLMQQCLDETLLHKWARPEEIADYCYFLTNINSSMTGQDLLVDNGEQLKSNFIW